MLLNPTLYKNKELSQANTVQGSNRIKNITLATFLHHSARSFSINTHSHLFVIFM